MSGLDPEQMVWFARTRRCVPPVVACLLILSLAAHGQEALPGDDAPGADPIEGAEAPLPEATSTTPLSPGIVALEADDDLAAIGAAPQSLTIDDQPTGTVPASTIDAETDLAVDRGAERVEAIEDLDRAAEEEPFAAVGIRMGSFILKPTLEQGVTATTNADSSAEGQSALLSETTLRLNAASDWTSHSATVDAYGIFRKTISGDEVENIEGGIAAALELELGKDYRANASLGYVLRPESATSPSAVDGVTSQPLRQTISGSLGLEKDAGKARFAVTGFIEDDRFGDADLEGGGVAEQGDRDATLYRLEVRTGYEISPALTPFVAAEIGRRVYGSELDGAGYARSSDRLGLRAGLGFDLGEKLSGELSAGWVHEDFDDARLAAISGLTIDGNVEWSPVRGTIVALGGSTTVEGTTEAGQSGSLFYAGNLSVTREMRANLTGNLLLGAAYRDYAGCTCYDLILSGEAGLTWWFNRYAGLTGRLRHEDLTSNIPDRDSDTSSVFLGLKLQR